MKVPTFGRASRAVHLRRRYDPIGHNAYMCTARVYVVPTYCFKGHPSRLGAHGKT